MAAHGEVPGIEFPPVDRRFLPYACALLLVTAVFVAAYLGHSTEEVELQGIRWMAADRDGRLWFTMEGALYRGQPEGPFTRLVETGLPGHGTAVTDLAVVPDGRVLVSDPLQRQIRVYADSGVLTDALPGRFLENGKLAADTNHVYVADMQRNRVLALDNRTGELVWERTGYQIPDDISYDGRNVVVSDQDRHVIEVLEAATGALVTAIKIEDQATFTAGSTIVAIPGQSEVLLTGNWFLSRYSYSGQLLERIPCPPEAWLIDLAVTPAGRVFIPDPTGCRLWELKNKAIVEVRNRDLDRLLAATREARSEQGIQATWFFAGMMVLLAGWVFFFVMYSRARAAAGLVAPKPVAPPESAPALTPAERKRVIVAGLIRMLTVYAAILLLGVIPFVPLKRLYLLLLIAWWVVCTARSARTYHGKGPSGMAWITQRNSGAVAAILLFGFLGMFILIPDWFSGFYWTAGLAIILLPFSFAWLAWWLRNQTPRANWLEWLVTLGMGSMLLALAPVGAAGLVWWTAVGLTPVPDPHPAVARPAGPTPITRAFDSFLEYATTEAAALPEALTEDTNGTPRVPFPVLAANRERLERFRDRFNALPGIGYYREGNSPEPESAARIPSVAKFFRAIGAEAAGLAAAGRTDEAAVRVRFLIESGERCLNADPPAPWVILTGHTALEAGGKAAASYFRALPAQKSPDPEVAAAIGRIHDDPNLGWDSFWWAFYWDHCLIWEWVEQGGLEAEIPHFGWVMEWFYKNIMCPTMWDTRRMTLRMETKVRDNIRAGREPYYQVAATMSDTGPNHRQISFWTHPTNFFGNLLGPSNHLDRDVPVKRELYRWESTRTIYQGLALAYRLREAGAVGRDPRAVWAGLPPEERLNHLTGNELSVNWQKRELTLDFPHRVREEPLESLVVSW